MLDLFVQIFNNKLLFFGIIFVVAFGIVSIILIVRSGKVKNKEVSIDVEKVDGDKSLFDEVAENKENNPKTSDGKLDLESMIEKMQKDLDAKASEVIEKFETEQEEKSIISYQELVENKSKETLEEKENYLTDMLDEVEKDNDVLDKKITLDEVLDKIEDDKIEKISNGKDENINKKEQNDAVINQDNVLNETYINSLKLEENNSIEEMEIRDISEEVGNIVSSKLNKKDDFVAAIKTGFEENSDKKEIGKFKATEFVSPIFGVQDIKMQYPTVQNMKELKTSNNYNKFELEQTLNMEPLTDEIRKDEDFLKALKEFRKNLE